MATHAHTTPNATRANPSAPTPNRRGLLAAGAALLTLAASTRPARPELAHPDAELLAAVNRYLSCDAAAVELVSNLSPDELTPEIIARDDALRVESDAAFDRAMQLRATTLDGLRAKGRLLHHFADTDRSGNLRHGEHACLDERAAWSLTTDLLALGGAAA